MCVFRFGGGRRRPQTNIIAEYTIPTASLGNPFDHEGAPIALVPHSDRLDDLMKSDVLSVVYVASGCKHGALNEVSFLNSDLVHSYSTRIVSWVVIS